MDPKKKGWKERPYRARPDNLCKRFNLISHPVRQKGVAPKNFLMADRNWSLNTPLQKAASLATVTSPFLTNCFSSTLISLFFTLLGIFCHLHVVAADIGTQKVLTNRSTLHHNNPLCCLLLWTFLWQQLVRLFRSDKSSSPKSSVRYSTAGESAVTNYTRFSVHLLSPKLVIKQSVQTCPMRVNNRAEALL